MKGKFLRKVLAFAMAAVMTAGTACIGAVAVNAAEVDVVPLTAVYELTNESTISAEVISFGKYITVNAKANGGTGGYTYSVLYKKKSDNNWTTKQKFTENSKVSIKPAKETEYELCVKVRDDSGKIAKKYFTFKVNPELKNNSVLSRDNLMLGESLKVYGRAEGGVGKYLYAVYYKKSSEANWTAKQNYSRNTVIPIKPAKAMKYNVCVKIKDEAGTVVKKYFDFTVKVDNVKEVFRLTNEERQKESLQPLAQDAALMAAAQKRAEEISEKFEHTRPDGTSCFTVFDEYNIRYWGAGENIAYGYSTPESVMKGWMNSPRHKDNILDSYYSHIGIGMYEKNGTKYWVQLFAKLP